jgi:hypothetical protein
MALPTNTWSSFDVTGNREDLSDWIYNISPTETPGLSMFPRASAKSTLHEWQTDSLAAAAANAQLEGNDPARQSLTATTRLSNTMQISYKTPAVTGTQEAIVSAGRKSEMAYQVAKAALELKRDMENDIWANVAEVTGSTSAARKYGSWGSWITTSTSNGSGGSDGSAGNTARTDGTQRAYTEALLTPVLQAVWDAGGNPDCIVLGSFNKRTMSTFTGNSTRYIDNNGKRLITSVETYESDWGAVTVMPNRFSRSRDVNIVEKDKAALAYLRTFRIQDLAKTGDSEHKQLVVEYALEMRNEAAHGAVWDLTTS